MSKVLLVEKNCSGHRLYYVRLLAVAAHERRHSVTIFLCADQAMSPEIKLHLSQLPTAIEIVFVEDLGVSSVSRLSKEMDATVTIVPDGDLFAIGLGASGRWEGQGWLSVLVMREIAQPSNVPGLQIFKSFVRRTYFRRASKIPRVRVTVLKSSTWEGQSEFPTAIDPVTMTATDSDAASLRDKWNLEKQRYWFGILGAISERKNVSLVAEALEKLPPDRVGFLLAGKIEVATLAEMADSLERLRQGGASVVVVDRLLEDLELDSAVRAVDCVVLAHSNEGSSGLFGKAISAGTRVVAAGALSLRRDCLTYPDGSAWSVLQLRDLSRSLERALASGRPYPVSGLDVDAFSSALLLSRGDGHDR